MKKSVLSIALVASLAFVLSLVGISSMVIRQAATANNSIAAPTPALSVAPTSPVVSDVHTTTVWSVRPSLAYDALNFFNALTGDPFYLDFYQDEYDRFHSQATPEVEAAIATLNATRQQYQFIVGAALSTVFAPGNPETIDDLLALAANPEPLHQALLQSGLGSTAEIEAKWPLVESLLPSVTTILVFLQSVGFEEYWRAEVLPAEQALAEQLQTRLRDYNVVPAVEALTGRQLPGNHVEIYLSYFNSPYGARIPGTRFIMETRVTDTAAFVRATIHELLHQPYDVNSAEFWAALDTLRTDPFVAQHFETHDVNRGYNDWQGYVGESCTDVAEQFISEELGIARPVRTRFGADEDGGMHVLAPALYVLARSEGFPQNGETLQAFVIRMVDEQKLAPGKLESLKEDFQALQKLSNGFGFPLIEQEKT